MEGPLETSTSCRATSLNYMKMKTDRQMMRMMIDDDENDDENDDDDDDDMI